MHSDRGIILLAFGQTLIWAVLYYSFPALLVHWEDDLDWSRVDLMGAITTAVLLSGVASPLCGRFIDRGEGAALMATSAALGGLCLLALSQVTTLFAFYALWGLIGVAMAGCLYEPCFALITRARGADAKNGIVLVTLVAGFAGTISFPISHALTKATQWQTTAVVFGLVAIIVAAPILWLGARAVDHTSKSASNPSTQPQVKANRFLRLPAFWLLAIGFSFIAFVHSATLHHLFPILIEQGFTREDAVFAAACIGPSQVAGRLAMVAAGRHATHRALTLTAFALIFFSVLLLQLKITSTLVLLIAIVCFGGAYGTISILRPLVARDTLGETHFGAKTGALALPYLASSALAPLIGALIWRVGGYGVLLTVLGGFIALGALLYWFASRQTAHRENP